VPPVLLLLVVVGEGVSQGLQQVVVALVPVRRHPSFTLSTLTSWCRVAMQDGWWMMVVTAAAAAAV
jgi:hypothetical protein